MERATGTTIFAREQPYAHRPLPPLPLSRRTDEEERTGTDIYARSRNRHPLTRPLPLPKAPSPLSADGRVLPAFPKDANVIHRDAMAELAERPKYERRLAEEKQGRIEASIAQARTRAREYAHLKGEARAAIELSKEARQIMEAAFDQIEKALGKATDVLRKFETFEAPKDEIETIDQADVEDWDERAA